MKVFGAVKMVNVNQGSTDYLGSFCGDEERYFDHSWPFRKKVCHTWKWYQNVYMERLFGAHNENTSSWFREIVRFAFGSDQYSHCFRLCVLGPTEGTAAAKDSRARKGQSVWAN